MDQHRIAIIDPAAGISGDMLLGALIGVGARPEWLVDLPGRLGFPEVRVVIETVERCGLAATKVTVTLPDGAVEHPAEVVHAHHSHASHDHSHAHTDVASGQAEAHGHLQISNPHGSHRHIGELIDLVQRARLSRWVETRAVEAFRLLGEAEGRVHGVSAEEVGLHEVGAVDALVDIVGAIEGFEQLGIEAIYHRPVALGDGWVRAAHGVIPIPAPATAALLEGLEIAPNGPVTGEATTPTGAVLLRVLSRGAPPARWRASGSGWGAGGRNPAGYPNALRLFLGEAVSEAGEAVMLATDIDDLNPEYLEPLREALMTAGALDVQIWATQMKKGRTGFRLELVTTEAEASAVTEALFRHSTTAGVRRWRGERVTLPRHEIQIVMDGMAVRVKIVDAPGGSRAKPEFDDVMALARKLNRPVRDVAMEIRRRVDDVAGLRDRDSSLNKEQ
ncbi:MAG: nickel pincer cofactor biosynthesis protein LarC [Gemmatimonadota bacterium]